MIVESLAELCATPSAPTRAGERFAVPSPPLDLF